MLTGWTRMGMASSVAACAIVAALACSGGGRSPSPTSDASGGENDATGDVTAPVEEAPFPVDDASGGDAIVFDGATSCDNSVGDLGACVGVSDASIDADPDSGLVACLSPAICARLSQVLVPRAAGFVMQCLAASGQACDAQTQSSCFYGGAMQACVPVVDPDASAIDAAGGEAGATMCDAVAAACASSLDLSQITAACVAMLPGLTVSGSSAYLGCVASAVDSGSFSTCALEGFLACGTTVLQ